MNPFWEWGEGSCCPDRRSSTKYTIYTFKMPLSIHGHSIEIWSPSLPLRWPSRIQSWIKLTAITNQLTHTYSTTDKNRMCPRAGNAMLIGIVSYQRGLHCLSSGVTNGYGKGARSVSASKGGQLLIKFSPNASIELAVLRTAFFLMTLYIWRVISCAPASRTPFRRSVWLMPAYARRTRWLASFLTTTSTSTTQTTTRPSISPLISSAVSSRIMSDVHRKASFSSSLQQQQQQQQATV